MGVRNYISIFTSLSVSVTCRCEGRVVSDKCGGSSKGPEVFRLLILEWCHCVPPMTKRYTGVECMLCSWPDRGVNEGVIHGFQSSAD